jgi:Family of unknown function (DUF6502)
MKKTEENRNSMVANAVSKVLRPLVRLLIKLGINFKDFSENAKRLYLEESVRALKEDNKEATSSALSVVSGIHRKDTSHFLKHPGVESSALSTGASAAMTVVTEWIINPDYLDKDKKPCPLIYSHSDAGGKTFTTLSNKVIKDLRAKTVLEELLRLELVQFEDEVVSLKQEAFIPQTDFNEKMVFFSKNISEHIQAAATNMQSQQPPHFERSAFHDGLNEEDIKQIDAFVRDKGMSLLKEAYCMAEELAEKNKQKDKGKTGHITLGIFLNHQKDDEEK